MGIVHKPTPFRRAVDSLLRGKSADAFKLLRTIELSPPQKRILERLKQRL